MLPLARSTERKSRNRDSGARNPPADTKCEVHKFPHQPSGTRGFWRQSGEKKPTERGWFFNNWWWGRTRFQIRAYRGLLVPMVRPRMAAESYGQLSLPRRCLQLSESFRSFLADQFMTVFRLKVGDTVLAKSPDRWVFHKVGDIHRCCHKPEEVLSDPMNHQVG